MSAPGIALSTFFIHEMCPQYSSPNASWRCLPFDTKLPFRTPTSDGQQSEEASLMAYPRRYQQPYHTNPQDNAYHHQPYPGEEPFQDPNIQRSRNVNYNDTPQWPEQDATWSRGKQSPLMDPRQGVRNDGYGGRQAEVTRHNPPNGPYGARNNGPGYDDQPNPEYLQGRPPPQRLRQQQRSSPMGQQGNRIDQLPIGDRYRSEPQRSDGYYTPTGRAVTNHTNTTVDGGRSAPGGKSPSPLNHQQPLPRMAPDRVEDITDLKHDYAQGKSSAQSQQRHGGDAVEKSSRHPKDRVLVDPTSLGTVSWDNPFPSFPTNRTKPKHTRDGDLDKAIADLTLNERSGTEHPRPPNAGQRSDQKPLRVGHNAYPQKDHPVQLYDRALQGSWDVPSSLNYPPNHIFQPHKDIRPQTDHGRRSEDTRGFPIPHGRGAFQQDGQRSRTMPSAISESMMHNNRQNIDSPPTIEGGSLKRADQTLHWGTHAPMHPQTSRPPVPLHSHSSELQSTRGYAGHEPRTIQPSPHHSQQGSFGEAFDSYYHSPHHSDSYYHPSEVGQYEAPSEADMPNFDAVPEARASHQRGMTIDDHFHAQQRPPNMPAMPPQAPLAIPNGDYRPPQSSQGIPRTKSSPNLQERGPQRSPQYSDGFNFELPGSVPAMYSRAPDFADDNQSNVDATGESFQPARSEWRQHERGQQPHYASQPRHPNKRPGTSGSQGKSPVIRSPDGQSQPSMFRNGASYDDQSRPARNGPSPIRPAGPALPPAGRPSNPDALPPHPAPVRPGLVHGTASVQSPRPAPVRQYSEGSSSRPETSSSQKAQISRAPNKDRSTAVTYTELERLRQVIKTNPGNNETQLLLAKKLAEAASVLADEDGRADAKTRSKNRERFVSDAYRLVKKLVQNGYPEAMFYLGDCYTRGYLGLEIEAKEAFSQYQSAAKLGHAQAAYRVAVCCEMGVEDGGGTKRDAIKAIQWYQRAATLGDTPAMYKMGVIQLKGLLGQQKNMKEALKWLQQAAEGADRENPHALHELALLFESSQINEGIRRDEAHAKHLFTEAANLGYKFSQFRLGCAYEYGLLGCTIDPRQSIAWYSKAAVQDEHQSELALSGWYLTGSEGVLQQSDTEAYLWARKAAQAGLAKAEYAMGYFTEVGIGAPANIEDAKRWYWRSASQNFPKARERLEDLRRGGAKMQKTRVSRSKINKQSEGEFTRRNRIARLQQDSYLAKIHFSKTNNDGENTGPNIMYDVDHPAYNKLKEIGKEITTKVKPKAVVVFSAHWQAAHENQLEINVAESTDLIHDFYGFPKHYYKEKYPHKGSREIATEVIEAVNAANIDIQPVKRGLDHGVWASFKVAFDPEQNPLKVPIVQVSLFASEDPHQHYHLGKAVSKLRSENIQIIVSGMAVHNLKDMFRSTQPLPYTATFDEALKHAVEASPDEREKLMTDLLRRPDARQAHPTFDHLLPIHVGAGAAGDDTGKRLWTLKEGSVSWAQYRFGDVAV
ncbi:MAG: hypothetical protein Q9218_001374 [Villophora microphyllina]